MKGNDEVSWVADSSGAPMPRLRHRCTRITLKCAFTAILVFVAFTLLLTFAFFGHQNHEISNRNSAIDQPHAYVVDRKVWRGVAIERSEVTQVGDREDKGGGASGGRQSSDTGWGGSIRGRGGGRRRGGGEEERGSMEDKESRRDGEEKGVKTVVDDRKQAMQVVNLLQMEPANRSSSHERTVPKKLLTAQIELLRDAMISQSSILNQPSVTPSCVGDVQQGEVEDLLCIPKPKYLQHIKNPCWYEVNFNISKQPKMKCLPYFHILGCAKSGTTDLWMRLMSHPHIIANKGALSKEGLWWSWQRYGFSGYKRLKPVTFKSYVNIFRDTARQIQSSIDQANDYYKMLITGDASPPDFWDFRGWPNITQNRGLDWPQVITPHLMKHFYDNPKFILMFRDPIDRLYSDYFFIGGGLTSQDFHQDVIRSISMLADCVKRQSIQGCFYNQKLYLELPVRLPFACYSVFMREWLRIFPLENFFFIKTEEYESNPEDTLKKVIKFLDLRPLRETKIQEMIEEERARVTFQKKVAGPMKPATKALLMTLLQPCNHMLARLIQQPRFIWDT